MRNPLLLVLLLAAGCASGPTSDHPDAPAQHDTGVVQEQHKPADEPVAVNLKAMGLFAFDDQNGTLNDVPQQFRNLDARRVRFVGEMWAPVLNNDGSVASFKAVYSIAKWSFRGPPHVQDFWECQPLAGVSIQPADSPIEVTGVLHVQITKADGVIKSIYNVDVEHVEPFKGDPPPHAPATTKPGL